MAKPPKSHEDLLGRARDDRRRVQSLVNGFMQFADPSRPRIGDSLDRPSDRNEEIDDRFDTTMQDVADDFASDLLHRTMPKEGDWLSHEAVETLNSAEKTKIEPLLKERTKAIFNAIRGSNFYDEAAGEWAWNLAHGTAGTISWDLGSGQGLHFEPIPANQLLIARGLRGLGFQARESVSPLGELMAYWPNYDWPSDLKRRAAQKGSASQRVAVLESAERVPGPGDEQWKWRVIVDGKIVHELDLSGRGACPISTTRWRTHSQSPWGLGPLLRAVPDARQLDQLRYLLLKQLGRAVDPPTMYDDDDTINVEGGISAGMWIPREPGSKVDQLESGRMDYAFFEQGGLQDAIRRAGYQAGPRQRGQTPPTLGQWMDEKAAEGRRLEQPTGKIYAEGVIALCDRVEYLLIQSGTIDEAIRVSDSKIVRVRPRNPLAVQQDFERANTARVFMETLKNVFGPEITASIIDTNPTVEAMKKAFNDEIVSIRKTEDTDPLLRGILGQPGMAPGLETAPPEAV